MGQFNFIEGYVFKGAIGVLVEVSVSNEAVVQSEAFGDLVRGLAQHIAAMEPISVEELLQQPAVADPDRSVGELVANVATEISVRIAVTRFVRWVANPDGTEPSLQRMSASGR